MRLELLDEDIQVFYCKMRAALSPRGYLEGLREILDELEWNNQTSTAYNFFLDKSEKLKQKDVKNFEVTVKWINSQLKAIRKAKWNNTELKNKILEELNLEESVIAAGRAFVPNYVGAMFNLLERIAKKIAAYGEFKVIEGLGNPQTLSVSFPAYVDPLAEAVTSEKIILPTSVEGELLMKTLGTGFISAKVLPPTKGYKANRYFIDRGSVLIEWPASLTKELSWFLGHWKVTFDMSAARCLLYLSRYAAWDEVVVDELQLTPEPSEKSLAKHYHGLVMKEHLAEFLRGKDEAKVREEIQSVLDRFILILLQHKGNGKGVPGNKEKAERYAYIQVKAILASKTVQERSKYTNEQVIDKIMEKVEEEDLMIKVTRINCLEACRKFERSYVWPKKRQQAKG